MIKVTIRCDHAEGPRVREGKTVNWCHTAQGGCETSPIGIDRNATTACAKARREARDAGWKQTKINKNGHHGWLCPPCYARAYGAPTDED